MVFVVPYIRGRRWPLCPLIGAVSNDTPQPLDAPLPAPPRARQPGSSHVDLLLPCRLQFGWVSQSGFLGFAYLGSGHTDVI